MLRPPPISTLFPYTTLFRSDRARRPLPGLWRGDQATARHQVRSEEHTSELQSRQYLVCRLLLEKTKAALDQRQREALLREQMAAIQRQLGEGDEGKAAAIA